MTDPVRGHPVGRFSGRVRKVVLLAPGGTVLRWSLGFFVRVMMILAVRVPGASEDTLRRVLHDLTIVQPELVAHRVLEFPHEPIARPRRGSEDASRPAVAAS